MLSPIASRSAQKALERRAQGEEIKGTGRRVNGLGAAPSIADRIAAAPSIDALALLREVLASMVGAGDLEIDARTRRRWNEALWVRVLELIQAPDAPDCPTYVCNVTLRWPKPDGLGEALRAAMLRKVAPMPAPASRFAIEGIRT